MGSAGHDRWNPWKVRAPKGRRARVEAPPESAIVLTPERAPTVVMAPEPAQHANAGAWIDQGLPGVGPGRRGYDPSKFPKPAADPPSFKGRSVDTLRGRTTLVAHLDDVSFIAQDVEPAPRPKPAPPEPAKAAVSAPRKSPKVLPPILA